jgi:transcriptional regulator with XRE-family HTH domain
MPERSHSMSELTNSVVEKDRMLKKLRQLREEQGLKQPDVAAKLGWTREKVGRIENDSLQAVVTDADIEDLLRVYGVTDQSEIDRVLAQASMAREPGWNEYRDVLRREYIRFLGYEEIASEMLQYHLSLIPGLLQTRQYMREIFSRVNEDAARNVRRLTEVRLRRQKILTAADGGPAGTSQGMQPIGTCRAAGHAVLGRSSPGDEGSVQSAPFRRTGTRRLVVHGEHALGQLRHR